MVQFHAENERMKRQYLEWLRDVDGKDEKTLDQIASSLHDLEVALGVKPFKAFHRDWGRRYKTHLEKCRNVRTGKPLSLSTRDARLSHVKAFFKWLAYQPGFKSRIKVPDVDYFNNNAKDARAAHAQRPPQFPTPEQCAHAFRMMPCDTLLQRRDKAVFALLILTGARDSAVASLRLQNVDLVERYVFQDGRYIDTKNSKTIESWFYPVGEMYEVVINDWVKELLEVQLFGPGDALFPKPEMRLNNGRFVHNTLSREPYANGQKINSIIRGAFRNAGLPEFTAHSFRKTLAVMGDKCCPTREAFKAWSQNMGHEHALTTVNAYIPVGRDRQRDLIRGLIE